MRLITYRIPHHEEITDSIRAYAAGIIDGEGSIHVGHRRAGIKGSIAPDYLPQIMVTMADKVVIDFLQKYWGGHVLHKEPHKNTNQRLAGFWMWYLRRSEMIPFLNDIIPFLLIKKPQAELLIEYINSRVTSIHPKGVRDTPRLPQEEIDRRTSYYLKFKLLNKRGR